MGQVVEMLYEGDFFKDDKKKDIEDNKDIWVCKRVLKKIKIK